MKHSSETEEYYVPVEVVEQEPMRDFGSKLADYEASDDPVMDLNSLESERTQFLRQNDDTEVVNEAEGDDDDDAVRCIPKVMQVSFIVNEGVKK